MEAPELYEKTGSKNVPHIQNCNVQSSFLRFSLSSIF